MFEDLLEHLLGPIPHAPTMAGDPPFDLMVAVALVLGVLVITWTLSTFFLGLMKLKHDLRVEQERTKQLEAAKDLTPDAQKLMMGWVP